MSRITHAMVLAAGRGVRMRPLTDNLPKALIRLRDQPLMDYARARLAGLNIEHIVVNTNYMAEKIQAHLAGVMEVTLSPEEVLLETGGGVRNALPHLGDAPFMVINCDSIWIDGPSPALTRLAEAWDPARMDALLMMQSTERTIGYSGSGDYFLEPDDGEVAPFVFTGVQVLHPRLFEDTPAGPFSLNLLYDRAERAGRLAGLAHDGDWYHVGTPEDLARAELALSERAFAGRDS